MSTDILAGPGAPPPNSALVESAEAEISLLDLLQEVADNLRLLVLGPLAAGLAALEWGDAITRRMPEELLAPLAEELSRIEHDLNRSAELLLASVP